MLFVQTRVGNMHEPQASLSLSLSCTTEGLTRTLRRHCDPITPLRIRNVDDDGINELQTAQRRMIRVIIQTNRYRGKGHAVAHSASVDDIADGEHHDPDSERVDATTQHHNPDPNEHEESSHDADSNPWFDESSEDYPEDKLERWVRQHNENNAESDRLVGIRRNRVVDPQGPRFTGGRQK